MNRFRQRTSVLQAAFLTLLAVVALGQVNDWKQGNGNANDLKNWFNDTNWSLGHRPMSNENARHPSNSNGSPDIVVNDTDVTAVAKTFEGQLGNANRSLTVGFGASGSSTASLKSLGDMFRSGSGATTYTVHLIPGSRVVVGDTDTHNANVAPGNLYGFRLDLDGDGSEIAVKTEMGYGPLETLPPFGGFGTFITVGLNESTGCCPGLIDCSFAGGGSPVDPISESPWTIGTGDSDDGGYFFTLFSAAIDNVGQWEFRPPGISSITTNNLDMYEEGGVLETFGMSEFGSGLVVTNTASAFSQLDPPIARFGGTSQWLYGVASGNIAFFQSASEDDFPSLLTFAGAASLLRPVGCEFTACPTATDYPTEPISASSLEIHDNDGALRIEVHSQVAADALAFDAALADLIVKAHRLQVESFTPDVCNVQFIDHLVPNGTDPVTPLPKYNRCVKYWHNLDLFAAAELPSVFRVLGEVDNELPDYTPESYPPEAYYFADAQIGSGAILQNEAGQEDLNAGRLYARTITNNSPDHFRVRGLALTRYMDADADFDVDLMDFARFQDAFTGSGGVTWYPLADFGTDAEEPSGDCDVDLYDYSILFQRWQSDDPASPPAFRVCEEAGLPDNSGLPNGSPAITVCGGPLHDRPTGNPSPPDLDCPNCAMYGLGCEVDGDPNTGCANRCPWQDGAPDNPVGTLEIAVVEAGSCSPCTSVSVQNDDAVIDYKIVGRLVNPLNPANPSVDDGLALWGADLAMAVPHNADAIALLPANVPDDPDIENFSTKDHAGNTTNDGVNNPGGYGGTPLNGALLQIGGAQNTILNPSNSTFPPTGAVSGDVAHDWTVLAEGSVTIPQGADAGSYFLRLSNVFANVIADGQLDQQNPVFYRTQRVDVRSAQHLRIRVDLDEGISIDSANPPLTNPYSAGGPFFRDVLQTGNSSSLRQGIGDPAGVDGLDTPDEDTIHYAKIAVTFSANTTITDSDVSVTCSYQATPCPSVTGVTGNGTAWAIELDQPIPPGGCTTFSFPQTCDVLRYESLPGDVNLDGVVSTQDLLDLITAINNGSANQSANWARYNIDRSHQSSTPVNTSDTLRLVQLLNGTNTTQVWSGFRVRACVVPECGGGSSSAPQTGAQSGESEGEVTVADAIAFLEAACADAGISTAECQAMIDNLFGPQP